MNLRNVRRGESDGCLLAMVFVILITVLNMGDKKEQPKNRSLPVGATDVVDLGNGWRQFTLNESKYMINDDGVVSKVDKK